MYVWFKSGERKYKATSYIQNYSCFAWIAFFPPSKLIKKCSEEWDFFSFLTVGRDLFLGYRIAEVLFR